MSSTDTIRDALRDFLAALAPRLVSKEDLARLDGRLEELLDMAKEIEDRIDELETVEDD
ncbi:hypothetical protein KAI87_05650 [Myxococcota bacterium]|nr:hypothetical protein [Myxococcota bacterium]